MTKNKNSAILIFAFSAAAAAVFIRCFQVFLYTDYKTGYIIAGAENTEIAFFVCLGISVLMCVLYVFRHKNFSESIRLNNNKVLSVVSFLCGCAMFYDFVHQCLNCYTYLSKNTYPALNRILPMSLLGVFSLFCSIYYFFGCLAFSSSKYNFNELKFFHFVPVMWAVCGICLGFTEYDDGLYAEETILKYTVLFFAVLFFLFFAGALDSGGKWIKLFSAFGIIYFFLSLAISVPRVVGLIFGAQLPASDFSSSVFMFSGIFAADVSSNVLFTGKD